MVSSGGEAKNFIKSGSVKVNGVIETRRGRKLNKGDKVIFLNNELIFELTGTTKEISNFIKKVRLFGIIELTRSGLVSMSVDSNYIKK